MTPEPHPPFKSTWPRGSGGAVRDLDLKRPGLVERELTLRVMAGALPGPPARPTRRRRSTGTTGPRER
ncbi:hypothetical protein [Conexibacter sp. S30A1]|uniref:hypothetical protein n=1 Tax=Conexibacter sp. S30A1 TaxID=2937800 RepID=UPI00200DC0FC|nr:hypothetical protein [Conexibacter sp. S30A1]